jgi:hypothetical protein
MSATMNASAFFHFRASVGVLLLAICFPPSAMADGTILTCTNLDGQDFTASGGIAKPDQPWKIMSIARRDWATMGYSM